MNKNNLGWIVAGIIITKMKNKIGFIILCILAVFVTASFMSNNNPITNLFTCRDVEDGKIRTYYELNPDYEIVENFGKIIIRLKEVEV